MTRITRIYTDNPRASAFYIMDFLLTDDMDIYLSHDTT